MKTQVETAKKDDLEHKFSAAKPKIVGHNWEEIM